MADAERARIATRWTAAADGAAPGARRRGGLVPLVVVVLGTLLVRAVALEPVRIPSESMLPTLRAGDHLFVDKLAFGAPLPFAKRRLPGLREPRRGEVVVFEVARRGGRLAPVDERPDWPRERFVKRIVGLPGDRVTVAASGLVSVNGRAVDAWATGEWILDAGGRPLDGRRAVLGGEEHAWCDDPGTESPIAALVVPPGRYLLLGDNRDHSQDGRHFGTVRRAELIGPAARIHWSRAPGGEIRWSRIGDRVH